MVVKKLFKKERLSLRLLAVASSVPEETASFLKCITLQSPREKGPLSVKVNVHRGLNVGYVLMILPQVHLRKPCYDFYFL